MTDTDEIRMMRYLFGELSEAEQAQLEERYFADPRSFDQVARLETRLLDDYSRGRLSAELRARLEQAYLKNPNRRARLKFSNVLTARVDQAAALRVEQESAGATSMWQRIASLLAGRPRALGFSLAAALLLLSFAALWFFIQSQRLRQELARTHDAEQQLARERDKNQQLIAELERARADAQRPHPTGGSSVASLILTVGEARGPNIETPSTLVIPHGTTEVRLQLKRSRNEYSSYQIVLQAVDGTEIFNRQHVNPVATKSGASFTFTFPASQLGAGDYLLTLRGSLPSGELEDVSQSLFRVEKQR